MNATRHAEHARRITPYVHQSMNERGLRSLRTELETALVELTPEQLQQVHAAAEALAKGSDGHGQMGLLAALRSISTRAARGALATHGILYRADVLLPLAAGDRTSTAFARDLAVLQRAGVPEDQRKSAADALRTLCGPLDHADLLPPTEAHSAAEPAVSLPPLEDSRGVDEHGDAAPAEVQPAAAAAGPMRRQVKVFGKASALTWETAPLRGRSTGAPASTTVMIEGATARAGGGGYDWANKVQFSCTPRELPQLLAVLMGWVSQIEFGFHGGDARKKLSIEHQDHGLFVQLQAPAPMTRNESAATTVAGLLDVKLPCFTASATRNGTMVQKAYSSHICPK